MSTRSSIGYLDFPPELNPNIHIYREMMDNKFHLSIEDRDGNEVDIIIPEELANALSKTLKEFEILDKQGVRK